MGGLAAADLGVQWLNAAGLDPNENFAPARRRVSDLIISRAEPKLLSTVARIVGFQCR
jgi:hypothetical protein